MDQDQMIEELIATINKHFDMDIEMNDDNMPVIKKASAKESLESFLNEVLKVIEDTNTDGKLNYYFDNDLDFDTPEEYHRY